MPQYLWKYMSFIIALVIRMSSFSIQTNLNLIYRFQVFENLSPVTLCTISEESSKKLKVERWAASMLSISFPFLDVKDFDRIVVIQRFSYLNITDQNVLKKRRLVGADASSTSISSFITILTWREKIHQKKWQWPLILNKQYKETLKNKRRCLRRRYVNIVDSAWICRMNL